MGCNDTFLPATLKKIPSVKCSSFEENTRKPYKDNLCLSRALAFHLQLNERLDEETSKLFILFFEKTNGTDPANFRGVCMERIAAGEDIFQADFFLHDIDIVDGSMIGELVGKNSDTVRLLRYNSPICYISNINPLFKAYRCTSCDKFVNLAQHPERHLTTCKERVKHVFPENVVYKLRKTLFDKLNFFNVLYANDQKRLKSMEIIDFESIYVHEDKFRDTNTTKWIGKHIPISVSISTNLIE